MAKETITGAAITVATVDLSTMIKKVTLTATFDDKETTAFGSAAKTRAAGLKDGTRANGDARQPMRRPLMTCSSTTTTAITSNTWMNPPMVTELTSPSSQRTTSTTAMV